MKLKQALNNIDNGIIDPIYTLKGNDYYLQNLFLKKLSSTYFKNRVVNRMLLLPDDMTGKEIVDSITNIDLFSSKKIFILREPQKLRGQHSAELLNVFKNPNEEQIIVVINDDWLSKSTFLKKIENIVDVIDVQTPFSNTLKKWINYMFNQKGKNIDNQGTNLLSDMAGDSLWHLDNEIQKICLFVGERHNITADDIRAFSSIGRDKYRWEFLLSLGEKNVSKATSLGVNLLRKNETMSSLIFPMSNLFQEILFFKMNNGTFVNSRSYNSISASLRKRLPEFAERYSYEKIYVALRVLGNIDKRQKTSYSINETELLYFIGNVLE